VIRRIALVLEYDGTGYCGWQRQRNAPSIQAHLERAIAGIEGRRVSCHAAGRTDAGVHAEAMLVHTDVSAERFARSPLAYVHGINQKLPASIRVLAVRGVGDSFHARFSCRERSYRYQIWNRTTAPAIHRWRHWWMPRPLDLDAMRRAASFVLGRHDFSAFRASGCQAASAVRELREIRVWRRRACVMMAFRADAFLYRMVRNLVGCLVRVGVGAWDIDRLRAVLEARDRTQAADTAPPYGLYFSDAVYDDFSSHRLRVRTESPTRTHEVIS